MGNKVKPRCPVCGKALYRTEKPKDKRTTPLYPYCRNESCKLYGDIRKAGYNPGNDKVPNKPIKKRRTIEKKTTSAETKPKTAGNGKAKGKGPLGKKRRRKAVPARKKEPWPLEKPTGKPPKSLCERCGKAIDRCKCEPESVTSTRHLINEMIGRTKEQEVAKIKSITAMSVVVLLQELGDQDVADILIDRYDLGMYGLKKGSER